MFNVILLLLLLLLFTKYSQLSPCGHYGHPAVSVISLIIRDGPLENLLGGGGGREVQKKYSRKGKLNEKKKLHARQLTLKIFMLWPTKKIHTRNLITKKKSPPPPHNFSNGPSLLTTTTQKQSKEIQLLERAMYIVRPYTHEKAKKNFFIQTISQSSPVHFHFSVNYSQ